MNTSASSAAATSRAPAWTILVARWIFVLIFAMALAFKLADIHATAAYIGAVGFPVPLLLAWLAALFEALVVLCLATGVMFRQAAIAAGRMRLDHAVPDLFNALRAGGDRFLEHSLIYALIEIGDGEGTAAGLKSTNSRTRRAALIALDQMDGRKLDVKTVSAELTSTNAKMKEAAWWIAGRHPEWGGPLAGFLRDRLNAKSWTEAERTELVQQLARFAGAKPVQTVLSETLSNKSGSLEAREMALHAMARAGLKETPPPWLKGVSRVLNQGKEKLMPEAIAAARAFAIPKQELGQMTAALQKVGHDSRQPEPVRLGALAAVPGGLTSVEPALFEFLRLRLSPDQPVAVRGLAVDILAKAKLNSEQLISLTDSVKTIGPMEIDRLLEAFAESTEEKIGLALLAAVKVSPARSSLRVETLKPRLAKHGAAVQKQAEELYAALDVDASRQRARLEQLLTAMQGGDIRRGHAIFNGTKAACSACHAIGYLGGNVGPDLTHIGKIRSERDLLESIVFPSATLVRSYEPVVVTTKSGKLYNGLIRKESPDEIVLATGANEEARIARKDIDEMQPSKVSVMPAGLDQQLTPRELADLVAFLKACK